MKTTLFLLSAALIMVLSNSYAQTQFWGTSPGTLSYESADEMGVYGLIFKTGPNGKNLSPDFKFATPSGQNPQYTKLCEANNGKLYGMTAMGGNHDNGVIFEYDTVTKVYTVKFEFTYELGSQPYGSLVKASNGLLYGLTSTGGSNDAGVLFEYNPANNTYVKKFNFGGTYGIAPYGSLTEGANGKLYGMTNNGGSSGSGVIFEYNINTGIYTKKIDFSGPNGANPYGDLTKLANGKMYGMTANGGLAYGTIFEYNSVANSVSKVCSLNMTNGQNPRGSLILTSGGKLYGMTSAGGINYAGVVFELDTTGVGTITVKYDFNYNVLNAGTQPFGNLMQDKNGNIFGMTSTGGEFNSGTLFQFLPASDTCIVRAAFNPITSGGISPYGTLMQASNNRIYGLTYGGGANSGGTLFEFNAINDTIIKKADINLNIDNIPNSSLLKAANGKLYGTTENGGKHGFGVIYEYDPVLHKYTALFSFNDTVTGSKPDGLMQALNGKLYGVTSSGASTVVPYGAIYEFDLTTKKFIILHAFNDLNQGGNPVGKLLEQTAGKFYGMTNGGGLNSVGVLYQYTISDSTYAVKISFDNNTLGAYPEGSLLKSKNDTIYGMTSAGGNGGNGYGTLFKYDPVANSCTQKVVFDAGVIGANPYGSLIQATNDTLYGLTSAGGLSYGTLFSYNITNGRATGRASFDNTNGAIPYGDLMQAKNNQLYGLTTAGGKNGTGVIFEYNILTHNLVVTSHLNKLQAFSEGSLIEMNCTPTNTTVNAFICQGETYKLGNQDLIAPGTYTEKFTSSAGCDSIVTLNLKMACPSKIAYWGMTQAGGTTNNGAIYSVNEKGENYTLEYSFTGGADGNAPMGGLIQAGNGKLYGMTSLGGTNSAGVIFEYNPVTKIYAKKVDFGGVKGANPKGDLVKAPNGKFYGLTSKGGAAGSYGVLFEFDPITGIYTKKVDFDSTATGAHPIGSLLLADNGKMYGLSSTGGSLGLGVLFEYTPGNVDVTNRFNFDGSATGANPLSSLMQANNGLLYGTASKGGTMAIGTLFSYNISNNSTSLVHSYSMDSTFYGSCPQGKLLQAPNGLLYGVTERGGSNQEGVLFSYDYYNNYYTSAIYFDSALNGKNPHCSLTLSTKGSILGTTTKGGTNNKGVLFEYDNIDDLANDTLITKYKFNPANGVNPNYGSLILVKPNQVADFTYTVSGFKVTFVNQSVNASTYNWSFGDGEFSQTASPVHDYKNAGIYMVCLKVFNPTTQQTSETCSEITIGNPIVCKAQFNYTVSGNTVTLTNTSTAGFTDVYWDFGDGTFSDTDTTQHTYKKPDFYEITLITYNSTTKCLAEITKLVQVSFNSAVLCNAHFSIFGSGTTLSFTNESQGLITDYFWDFGDGTYSFDKSPAHTYAEAGYYKATLTINDTASKCQDEKSKEILAYELNKTTCNAKFSFYPKQNKISFTSQAQGTFKQHFWDFNDGTNSNLVSPVHTFAKPGYYDVSYSIYDTTSGCFDTQYKTVFIEGASDTAQIKAQFNYMPSNGTTQVKFKDASLGSVNKWYWDFGDNSAASSVQNPVYVYDTNNYYKVCLTVGNTINQETNCKYIAVGDVTNSSTSYFTYFADSVTATGYFKNKSLGNIVSYYWDFGDGNESTQKDPSHAYADTGYYAVCLTTKSASGVQKTYCNDVRIGNAIANPCLYSCVWPGDANNDLEANHYDIMTIGLNYNLKGPKREDASTKWYGQFAQNWSTYQLDSTNNKYGDANGDGIINITDVDAIEQNFAFSHYFQPDVKGAAWQIECVWNKEGVKKAGSRSSAKAQLSPPAKGKAGEIYAIGYEIEVIGGEKIKWDSVTVNFDNSWIGEDGVSMLTVTNMDTTKHIIYIGMTRIDQQNIGGSGEIAEISFKFKDDVDEKGVSFNVTTKGGIEATGEPTAVAGSIELALKSPIEICQGETAIIDAGSGFETYTWSNNATDTSSIEVTEAGLYVVTVTNARGSSASDTVEVMVNALPAVDLGSDITQEESVVLDAGSGFSTYLWSNGSTDPSITVTETGEYAVSVSSDKGCFGADTINITIVTGINSDLSKQLSVYPNPNNGKFWLVYDFNSTASHTVEIINIEGKTVWHNEFKELKTQKNNIEVENLEKGVYYLKVIQDNNVGMVRFVVL